MSLSMLFIIQQLLISACLQGVMVTLVIASSVFLVIINPALAAPLVQNGLLAEWGVSQGKEWTT